MRLIVHLSECFSGLLNANLAGLLRICNALIASINTNLKFLEALQFDDFADYSQTLKDILK